MAKKLTRKEKIALQQEEAKQHPAASKRNPRQEKAQAKLRLHLALIISAFAFILYSNTLNHQYALDDYSLIKENTMTRKGISAIGEILSSTYRSGYYNLDAQLYRPLSKVFFAIEWQLAHNDPSIGHWVNVLLFALTGFLLFYALSLYWKGNLLMSFLVSSFFIAHPVHTEVVANIKSLDEILCFLFFVIAIIFVFHYLKKNSNLQLLFACCSFFLSLLSKESAITFLAVLPLLAWFFTDAKTSRIFTITACFVVVAGIFLFIRTRVIGSDVKAGEVSVVDNLLSGQDFRHRFATAVFIMGIYLKLFFFPHPLVSDRSLRDIPVIDFSDWRFLVSFAVYVALAIYAILQTRKKNTAAFGIFYFFITASVASNIIMLIGTSYGERLMYTPSLGFCIAVGALLAHAFKNVQESAVANSIQEFMSRHSRTLTLAGILLLLYSFKTFTRNPDWHDNLSLYTVDVKTAPLSARTHYYLGNHLSQDEFLAEIKDSTRLKQTLDTAIKELTEATKIYPQFADAYQQIGKVYITKKDFKTAAEFYKKAIGLNPQNPLYHNNYGNVLFNVGHYDEALKEFQDAVKWNPAYAHAYNNLASVYGALGENAQKQHDGTTAMKYYENAIFNFKKAIESDPEYAAAYYFLGITYRNIGDENNAQFYINKSKALQQK